jgi:hypothetical protein
VSYVFYITRADDWMESDANPIPLQDWCDLIERRPDLRPQSEACARNPATGERTAVPLPEGAALDFGDVTLFLSYNKGAISVSASPEESPIIREIASDLGAKVLGEEGEPY